MIVAYNDIKIYKHHHKRNVSLSNIRHRYICGDRMRIGGWQELGDGGNGQKLVHGFKVLLWGVRNVLELNVLNATELFAFK